jgi:outer membrane protein assembly factor BamB
MTIPNAALEAATAPTSAQVTRTKIYAGYNTAKTAHFASATQAAVLLYKDEVNKHASFAVMNPATGADVVAVVDLGSVIGEGTDMQLVGTTHAVIVGQGKPTGMTVGYSGKLTKVALSDGSRVWTKEYSSCGAGTVAGAPAAGECSKGLIFNECWGVAVMADGGFAISCGTGIENCNAMSGAMLTACTAGLGDKRAGAFIFCPSKLKA